MNSLTLTFFLRPYQLTKKKKINPLPASGELKKMHFGDLRKLKEQWYWLIREAMQNAGFSYLGNTSFFKTKVICDVTLYYDGKITKQRDEANLTNDIDKLIIDQFIERQYRKRKGLPLITIHPVVHLLVDDSPEYFSWGKIEQKKDTPARLVLTLRADKLKDKTSVTP